MRCIDTLEVRHDGKVRREVHASKKARDNDCALINLDGSINDKHHTIRCLTKMDISTLHMRSSS